MPLYEFRCADCGLFDLRHGMQDAPAAAPCPSCARPARRVYTVSGGGPSSGPLRGLDEPDRGRVDRARSGEPLITGPPSGRRPPRPGGHRH